MTRCVTSDVCRGQAAGVAAEGGSDGAHHDVRELDVRFWVRAPQVFRLALLASRARPAQHARLAGRRRRGVCGIEPEHAHIRIIPERQHKDHSTVQSRAHLAQTSLGGEIIDVTKLLLLLPAQVVCDRVASSWPQNGSIRVFDDLAVLNIEAANLGEIPSVRAIMCQELRDDFDGPRGVNSEAAAMAIEAEVAHTIRIVIAAILVAQSVVTLVLVIVSAGSAIALCETWTATRVRCVRCCHAVCLPDVHLRAATAIVPHRRHMSGVPVFDVGLALDEFDVMRALSIAIAGSVLCTGLVVSAIKVSALVHLHKVDGTVQATRKVADIHIQCELPVLQLEHLVGIVAVHHIQAGTIVGRVPPFRYKPEVDAVLVHVCGHTICASVICTLERASLSTGVPVNT
mmetsp:Transcript_88364/g.245277  ORF Transcript_88364/g.245277 Transcript_88364/m.245277 type:complete len:400 (-) Transcript_88364:306-1505(-)